MLLFDLTHLKGRDVFEVTAKYADVRMLIDYLRKPKTFEGQVRAELPQRTCSEPCDRYSINEEGR